MVFFCCSSWCDPKNLPPSVKPPKMWLDWSCYAQDPVTWVAGDFDGAFFGCAQLPACASHRCLGEKRFFFKFSSSMCGWFLWMFTVTLPETDSFGPGNRPSQKESTLPHVVTTAFKNRTIFFVSKLEASPKIRLAKTGFWPTTCESLWPKGRIFFQLLSQFGGGG